MKKKQENYLDRIPKIPADLSFAEEDGVVTIRRENKGLFNRIAQKCFRRPVYTYVSLDAFGSFVFRAIDGVRDVKAIGDLVEEEFGEKAAPVYSRLSTFVEQLRLNGFVEF